MRTEGSRYTGFRPVTEIAKDIRKDIKAAVANGTLPSDLKVSVRSRSYAGGQSLDIDWSASHGTHGLVCSFHRIPWGSDCEETCDPEFYLGVGYSPLGQHIEDTLKSLASAYNYDNSDVQSDYFDTLFYCFPSWDWKVKPRGTNFATMDPAIADTFATFVYTDFMKIGWAVKLSKELFREEETR